MISICLSAHLSSYTVFTSDHNVIDLNQSFFDKNVHQLIWNWLYFPVLLFLFPPSFCMDDFQRFVLVRHCNRWGQRKYVSREIGLGVTVSYIKVTPKFQKVKTKAGLHG